jgi:hypothetical protein
LRVQSPTLAQGDRKWQKTNNKNQAFDKLCLGGTMLQHSTRNPKIEGMKPANGTWRGNMAKILSIKLGI